MITTRKRVHFGDGFHHCLSNFSAHRITLNRRKSPTSEHLYQESKFFNVKDAKMIRLEIREADSPFFAKEIAHENRDRYRPEWMLEIFKVQVMYEILFIKAIQHKEVRKVLYSTGNKEIVELHPGDRFWAGGHYSDENWLGRCWMMVRSQMWNGLCREFNTKSA
jgi:ribA/ribD-fused uncharacterized protein